MNNYEHDLIRHYVGKALKEAEDIDCTRMDREDIELALWGSTGDIKSGLYMKHPSKHAEYEHYQEHVDVEIFPEKDNQGEGL